MNTILLGPPGSGKGTQGARLAGRLGVPKIATGDLLRAAVQNGTPLGTQAKSFMERGLLVPDDVILGLIGEVLASSAAAGGVIMDGFPRTIGQAEAVDEMLAARGADVTRVIVIDVPEDELIRRMLGRAAEEGRSDDTPETVRKRLAVYRDQTAPLIARYGTKGLVRRIDGTGGIPEIAARLDEALDR